jgi:hypothetical protein
MFQSQPFSMIFSRHVNSDTMRHPHFFVQNLSQFGALLFYLGMKNSANRNKLRKKHVTKPKSL